MQGEGGTDVTLNDY